jgi:sulfite exporter TauE/SafE/copper chaperone CopZ
MGAGDSGRSDGANRRVRTTVPISGMTCGACEVRVGKLLRGIPGVKEAKVSLAKGQATVLATGSVPAEQIEAVIEQAGYHVGASALPAISRDKAVWRDLILAAIAMTALVWGANGLGLNRLTDRMTSANGTGSLGIVLALGVIASLSTCMALVGGLVLSLSAKFAKDHPGLPPTRRLRPQAMFNLGRVAGFAGLGALLGTVGAAFQINGRGLALLTLAVALVMGVIGLRLTGVSPRAARVSVTLPAGLTRWMERVEGRRAYRDSSALLLGVGSFFLPCAFTQAVQVFALATGSPVRAGAIMGVFALGTAPGLFAVGSLGALASGKAAAHVFRLAGVAVLAFALVNVVGAVRILNPGLGRPAASTQNVIARSDNVSDDDGTQVLRTVQSGGGYEPATAAVYAGRPVRWEIESKGLSCASSMNLEAMGLGYVNLQPGANVVEFTPNQVGTLVYTCGMGMFPASIEVIPAPSDAEDAQDPL